MKRTHIDLFDDNRWGWTLSNATISGGVLDITANGGYGQRSPDANWYSGANNDFILEVDFKQDSIPLASTMTIYLKLVDDATFLVFYVDGRASPNNLYRIFYGAVQASTTYNDDTAWHTLRIRRVGTVYYFSINGGTEISWDYGTARAIEYIRLRMEGCTGDYDNFKFSFINIPVGAGVGNPLIL